MDATPDPLERDARAVMEGVLDDAGDRLLVVDPSTDTVESLIDAAVDRETRPELRLLAAESVLKTAMDDFLVASKAADLVEAGDLDLRLLAGSADNALLVSESAVTALVAAGDRVAALSTADESFVAAVREAYEEPFAEAEAYTLRTPPISRVRDSLEAEVGETTRADFDAVLSSMETARGDGDGLDEVTVSLLVAAKNEELLYDISKWGEDAGVASKATFSRTKTRLEEMGLITTEKVPIDIGRPRLRLKLGHDRLHGASADELADVASSLLT